MNNQSVASIDIKKMEAASIRNKLMIYPEEQARAIARHYASHAYMANRLLSLIELRDIADYEQHNVICWKVDRLVEQIKNNHLFDLGIELDWS